MRGYSVGRLAAHSRRREEGGNKLGSAELLDDDWFTKDDNNPHTQSCDLTRDQSLTSGSSAEYIYIRSFSSYYIEIHRT